MQHACAFVADIHIEPGNHERVERFTAFLDTLKDERIAQLYILGDLFEMWIGPGHERDPDHQVVLRKIAELTKSGIEVLLFHGNRDFLLGPAVERLTGASVVGEHMDIKLGESTVHLCHGDHLCEKDMNYQKLRVLLRHKFFRAIYQSLPFFVRSCLAKTLRIISRRTLAGKSQETVGFPQHVLERLFHNGSDIVICGHAHIERCEVVTCGGRTHQLFNLGDWATTGSYLVYAGGAFQMKRFPMGTQPKLDKGASPPDRIML